MFMFSPGVPDVLHYHQACGWLLASAPGTWHEGPGRSEEDHYWIWAESHWCRHWGRTLVTQIFSNLFMYLYSLYSLLQDMTSNKWLMGLLQFPISSNLLFWMTLSQNSSCLTLSHPHHSWNNSSILIHYSLCIFSRQSPSSSLLSRVLVTVQLSAQAMGSITGRPAVSPWMTFTRTASATTMMVPTHSRTASPSLWPTAPTSSSWWRKAAKRYFVCGGASWQFYYSCMIVMGTCQCAPYWFNRLFSVYEDLVKLKALTVPLLKYEDIFTEWEMFLIVGKVWKENPFWEIW